MIDTPLFSSELQEDLYTKHPKDEAELQERERNPRHLPTRLMFYVGHLPLNTRLMYFNLLNLNVEDD